MITLSIRALTSRRERGTLCGVSARIEYLSPISSKIEIKVERVLGARLLDGNVIAGRSKGYGGRIRLVITASARTLMSRRYGAHYVT